VRSDRCWLFNFGKNAAAVAEMLNVVTLAPLRKALRWA
jgi:hypothetical protein